MFNSQKSVIPKKKGNEFEYYKALMIHGALPADFWNWELDNGYENLGEYAAKNGLLPKDFNAWLLFDKMHQTILANLALANGPLPSTFDDWAVIDGTKNPVAINALRHDHLPKDFNRWDITNHDQWTVAHEAAWLGKLPEGFNQWELADNRGITVAHIYADRGGTFPPDSTLWFLKSKNGYTVADIARNCQTKDNSNNIPKIVKRNEILDTFPQLSVKDMDRIYSKLEYFKDSQYHTDDHITVTLDHHLNYKQINQLKTLYNMAGWEKITVENSETYQECNISFYF